MNFVYKCWLQRLFSVIPRGEKFNFLFQKYVTRTYPQSDKAFITVLKWAKQHFDNLIKYGQSDPNSATYYEFGAGWDLINPIALSLLGIQTLNCVDIRQLVFPELLNDTISRLHKLKGQAGFDYSVPQGVPLADKSNFRDILEKYFRIDYSAPMDARATRFEDDAIDFIVSNATLEHIPGDDIVKILNECHRISKDGAIVSCLVDYQDHWSYFDGDISRYNFLRYSPCKWRRYNPSMHYQNRLRHKDYLEIISKTAFEVLEADATLATQDDLDLLRNMKIDSCFLDNYTLEELGVKSSWIVLKK